MYCGSRIYWSLTEYFVYDPKGAATKAYDMLAKEVFLDVNQEKERPRHKDTHVR